MNNWTKRFEFATNLLIIVVSVAVLATMVRFYWFPPRPRYIASIERNMLVNLPGVDWHASSRTLVLALSTQCHLCTESAPFYKRLVEAVASRSDTRIIAVLPQTIEESRAYLRTNGIEVESIRRSALAVLHVNGTPTIIAVDRNGRVIDFWVGKLAPENETAVLSLAGSANPRIAITQ